MSIADALALFFLVVYLLAISATIHVLKHYRTAQGAIGWIVGLLAFPYLTLPLYFLFGRYRFVGYAALRRSEDQEVGPLMTRITEELDRYCCQTPRSVSELDGFVSLLNRPFTRGNHLEILVDGQATYEAMFAAIAKAQDYVLLEFYIIRDDDMGRRLSHALLEKLQAGIRVYFLYDYLGSVRLSRRYLRELEKAGGVVRSFNTVSRRPKRTQINFRNHRKILVVDGQVAFTGGLNIGNEYLGQSAGLTPWRDTHLRLEGPAARVLQEVFLQDWYWSSDEIPHLSWEDTNPALGQTGDDMPVLVIPSSAADERATASLFFLASIHAAKERLWITSPYFVPDLQIMQALELAVLRGVDVRLLVPEHPDNWLVKLAARTYIEQALKAGVRVYLYEQGVMHQKVMCVDDRYATVGTINLDNRSLHLNFEVTVVVAKADFAQELMDLLQSDFDCSREASLSNYCRLSGPHRLACRAARLMGPLL